MRKRQPSIFFLLAIFGLLLTNINAQQLDPSLYSTLRWRMLGPFRAGRVNAVSGVIGQPDTFYFGSVGGGLWKSQNSGRTWTPSSITSSQPPVFSTNASTGPGAR